MSAATPTNVEEIITTLRQLTAKIASIVAEAKSEGLLKPTKDNYSRYIVSDGAVKDSDYGVERVSFELEHYTKESWFHATRIVTWRLEDTEEYVAAATLLHESALGMEQGNQILQQFTHRVSYTLIETEDEDQRQRYIEKQLSIITKHLKQEVFDHSTTVRLVGLAAPSTPVHFRVAETEVLLRRVTAEDLVDERSDFFRREQFPRDPTAILRLTLPAKFGAQVQRSVWKAITILRLFKVGSLRDLSYTLETESYLGLGGTHVNHEHQTIVIRSAIDDSEVSRLEEFWKRLSNVIPEEGYEHQRGHVSPVEIAYQRYLDSLQVWGATVERRISDAVMGLESLFLTRNENQELAYRLRMRIAKVLGLLGYDPYLARKVANDSYTVRSSFVHGDSVEDKDRKLIVRRYENFEGLLNRVLNQLRMAIVTLSLISLRKEELIKLIDDSFIDSVVHSKLSEALLPAQKLLHANEDICRNEERA